MRVTYVLQTSVWGGAETYVAGLLQELVGRITPVVVTTRPVPQRLLDELPPNVEVRTVESVGRKGDLGPLMQLISTVRATKPDLVHVNQATPANNRYGLVAARFSGAPAVTTVHSPEPVRSRLQKLLLPVLFRGVRTVIAVSDDTRDVVLETALLPAARVLVILNGVPLPQRAAGAESHGDRLVLGSLGRLVREKAYDTLVEAVSLLHDTLPITVRIAGEGSERTSLEARARGLPVTFVGEVTDTAAFLRGLDLFCLPSRREGLPFALLEAMAVGVPCIAADVGQVRAALGSAVVVVPPEKPQVLAQAIERLADDRRARELLGARGRELVKERFDARTMAAAVVELYERATH